MSRWSEAYKASHPCGDTVDSVDTKPLTEGAQADCVSSVSTVTGERARDGGVDEAMERAAIMAEAEPVRRVRKRMPSWRDINDVPAQGDFCGCCIGHLWWTEAETPLGWRCCQCHGPGHLQAGQFRVEAT